jgi:hypothetical protein
MTDTHESTQESSEEIWLLGVPKLDEFVSYVKRRTEGGRQVDEGALIDRWRAAAKRYDELQGSEKGIAETAEIRNLTAAMQPMVEQVLADPHFKKVFSPLPIAFGLVELDKLIVYQRDITIDHLDRVRERLGAARSDEALFRTCLPFDHPRPDYRVGQSGGKFVFHSASMDLRFLGAQLLDPQQLTDFVPNGPAVGIVALIVGFGSNYLNAVRFRGRMVLNNGYHRAYALRSMGITHAPCVIQAASHEEEIAFAGSSKIDAQASLYFETARPPLLKDFFDPALTQVFRTPRVRRHVQISFDTVTLTIPE